MITIMIALIPLYLKCNVPDRLKLRYFFNAGIDKETGICDGEGTDFIYIQADGEELLLGSLYGFTPDEVSRMSDIEFEQVLTTSYIPKLA